MKHSKIPKKNRKKLKSVDPFNKQGNHMKEKEISKKNNPPKSDLDDQLMPRGLIEIGNAQAKLVLEESMPTFPKKTKKISAIDKQAGKHGFQRKQFEGDRAFLARINRETYNNIADINLKAKFETAGRDKKEIDKDYEEVDEKVARKKELKRKRFEKIQAKKRAEAGLEPEEKDEAPTTSAEEPPAKKSQKPKKKKSGKDDEGEMMLNAREFIAFGERNDAPPSFTFNKALKKSMVQKNAKAGGKDLLLNKMFTNRTVKETVYGEDTQKKKAYGVNEADRLAVIQAYRDAKARRRVQNPDWETPRLDCL
ncbi:unnamed protein product, partial [Mesorhabditis spiculigera]